MRYNPHTNKAHSKHYIHPPWSRRSLCHAPRRVSTRRRQPWTLLFLLRKKQAKVHTDEPIFLLKRALKGEMMLMNTTPDHLIIIMIELPLYHYRIDAAAIARRQRSPKVASARTDVAPGWRLIRGEGRD